MSDYQVTGENKTPRAKAPPTASPEIGGRGAIGRSYWRVAGICVGLAALVFMVFGRTVHFEFIDYDDDDYVYTNPIIAKGLSLANVRWAFTHTLNDHWHPLTAMLLMLEYRIFGLWPGGYHLVNVALHATAVVLLFLVLMKMTGAPWRSAFAAALFGIHPLRAESVAWVSECKDVLSAAFFMLTLWAYVRYALSKSRWRYAMVMLWLALGLMSKPMLVTVPCVLLLMDYWPLGRLRSYSQFRALLVEKIPLFILSALSSMAAILALKSGTKPISTYPANAPIAYVAYLWKLIYPIHLAAVYPLPKDGSPAWETFDSILILAMISAGAWVLRRKYPYLLIGWLWFLGMLVPVLGVMQTGRQAYADRYSYLPQIGLCFAGTWLAADLAAKRRHGRGMLTAPAAAVLGALAIACWHQVGYWRDSMTLWTHTLEWTRDNPDAEFCLGVALAQQGRYGEAIAVDRAGLRLEAGSALGHNNLGFAFFQEGRLPEAVAEYRESEQLEASQAEVHRNLGNALLAEGRAQEAVSEYKEFQKRSPEEADAHFNLGTAYLVENRAEDAIEEFRKALQLDPNDPDYHNNLGNAFLKEGRAADAIEQYREAVRLKPTFSEAYNNIGYVLLQEGNFEEAIGEFREALKIDPSFAAAKEHLAWALAHAPRQKVRDGSLQGNQAVPGGTPDAPVRIPFQ